MVRQVKGKILASDFDREFECSDISHGTDEFDDESLAVAVTDCDSTPVVSTPVLPATDETTWEWDIYDNRNDYCPEWLQQYQRRHGVLVETSDFAPVDYFQLFFPDTLFNLTESKTNRYALQQLDKHRSAAVKKSTERCDVEYL